MDELLRWVVFRHLNKPLRSIRLAHVFNDGLTALYADHDDNVFQIHCEKLGKISSQKLALLCGKQVVTFETGGSAEKGLFHMAVTANGRLYSWGNNSCGQLVNGQHTYSDTPILCKQLFNEKVVDVKCGLRFTIMLTDKGIRYSKYKKNRMNNNTNDQSYFTESQLEGVSQLEIYRENYFACLTKEGTVYNWNTDEAINQVAGLEGLKVKQIAMGAKHSLALTSEGQVFAWGDNSVGQLGNGTLTPSTEPVPILQKRLKRFIEIASHRESYVSAAMTSTGVVYVWGLVGEKPSKTPMKTIFKTLESVFSVIHKPTRSLKNIQNESQPLLFPEAFNNQDHSDVEFRVEDRTIYAHKFILMSASPYFRTMFSGQWKETEGAVKINSHSYPVYTAFIRYLYTGTLNIDHSFKAEEPVEESEESQNMTKPLKHDDSIMEELMRLAHEVQDDALLEQCVQTIRSSLNTRNVCSWYITARELKLASLLEYCRQFALKNLGAIHGSRGFARMPPSQAFEFTCYVVGNEHVEDNSDDEVDHVTPRKRPLDEQDSENTTDFKIHKSIGFE